MSLYVFAPPALEVLPDCTGVLVAGGSPPQPASMASARSATMVVEKILDDFIASSYTVVNMHAA
jgi:hypothetical protein